MNTWRYQPGPTLALVCFGVLVALCLLPRREDRTETALRTIRPLLQPTFSQFGSPSSPPDLSLKETLEARILAVRSYCDHQDTRRGARRHRQSSQEKTQRRTRGQLTWCGHSLTITPETNANLERMADENKRTAIQLDRDSYYSMPDGGNYTVMSWNIVEHPLLVLTRAFLELRRDRPPPRWEVPAGQRSGAAVTLLEVMKMAVTTAALPAAADACALCADHFDFVLHTGELDSELAFLVGEMGWTNTVPAAGEPSRHQLLRELVLQLPSVPRQLLQLVKQHFSRDLQLYGFELDLDALYDAVM